jgi:hypothetical protein
MQIIWGENTVKIVREDGDPKFYGIRGAKGEHALFHFLKQTLNAQGNDLIKKRAQRDGHMLGDEFQPYLRTRSARSPGLNVAIYSGFYALRGANEDWNEGEVSLLVELHFWAHN